MGLLCCSAGRLAAGIEDGLAGLHGEGELDERASLIECPADAVVLGISELATDVQATFGRDRDGDRRIGRVVQVGGQGGTVLVGGEVERAVLIGEERANQQSVIT